MAKQAWRFVMLVFTPARKAWNLIGGGAGTIATLWLMAHRHGFAAAIVGLSSAVFLLLVAGIRLQRKIDQTQKSNLVIGAPLVPPGHRRVRSSP